ncbi:MAG: lytic murein transglycosylase [Alphaproteobacteria bacterium]
MHLTRRTLLANLSATLTLPALALPTFANPPKNDFPAVPDSGFDNWVASFRKRAAKKGISDRTLSAAFADVGFLPGVIEKDRGQAEFSMTLQDYLSITASDDRVKQGRTALKRNRSLFAQIETAYGVESHVIAAIWGVESFYGTKRGTVPVISALSTLAYEGRRAAFFEQQLMAALKIVQHGDIGVQDMTGGWAGAMGHTQFIPTTYAAFAVDFTGDGRRDIWSDDPTDALASAANYIARSGWTYGQPWGQEVTLPAGFNRAIARKMQRRSSADWANLGIRPATGGRLIDHGAAALIPPDQATGPAFLVYSNYTVITRYNAAQKYVIGVGHLSDRLNGGGALTTPFPPDKYGLRQQDRITLQKRLTRLGYDTGGTSGVIGPKTRSAVAGYQQSLGLKADGNPSPALLATLR